MIEVGALREALARLADHGYCTIKDEGTTHGILVELNENTGFIDIGPANGPGGNHDLDGITATGAD